MLNRNRSGLPHLYDDDDSVQFIDDDNDSEEIEFMEDDDDVPVVKKKSNGSGSNSSTKDVDSQRSRSNSGSSDLSPVDSPPSVTENTANALGSLSLSETSDKHCCHEDTAVRDVPGLNISLLFPFLGAVAKATCGNFERNTAETQGFSYLETFPFKTFNISSCDANANPLFHFLHKLKCEFLQEVHSNLEFHAQLLEVKRHWTEIMATAQGGQFHSTQRYFCSHLASHFEGDCL